MLRWLLCECCIFDIILWDKVLRKLQLLLILFLFAVVYTEHHIERAEVSAGASGSGKTTSCSDRTVEEIIWWVWAKAQLLRQALPAAYVRQCWWRCKWEWIWCYRVSHRFVIVFTSVEFHSLWVWCRYHSTGNEWNTLKYIWCYRVSHRFVIVFTSVEFHSLWVWCRYHSTGDEWNTLQYIWCYRVSHRFVAVFTFVDFHFLWVWCRYH